MPWASPTVDTVVKNTSGKAAVFAFMPVASQRLDADQEVSIPGDLFVAVQAGKDAGARGAVRLRELQSALERGDLTIIARPAPIVTDQGTGLPVMLQSNNGVVTGVTPVYADSQV